MPECLRKGSGARLMGMIICSILAISLAGTASVIWAGNLPSGQPSRLPDPLTLNEALSYADAPGPDLDLARADVGSAQADLLKAASNTGVRSYLHVTPQWVDPSTNFSGGFTDDSSAQLTVTKRLYDFGQTQAAMYSAKAAVSAQRLLYFNARQQRRLEILKRFFDVLLADARYDFDSEETAYNYVSFDKARYRHGLGQISDVDLLAYEDRYRQALVRRTESQAAQRLTRAQLAIALNHPGDLPEDLVRPALPQLDRPVPEYEDLLRRALKANPVVLSLRDRLRSVKEKLAAAERQSRPFLEAELQTAAWTREFNGRNDVRATVDLCIPIYQGGMVEASVARARAEILRAEATLESTRRKLSTVLMGLAERVNSLVVARKASRVRSNYRELYADRSRSMYNLEIRTDLGDAMARLTEAQWQALTVDYDLALTWARIDALTGRLITPPPEEATR